MIERLLTEAPRLSPRVTRPGAVLGLVAWGASMFIIGSAALQPTALALATDLSAYGERAKWSGIYYRGEKIGFSVSQTEETGDGFRIQEDGQMQLTLMGATTFSKLRTEVNVDREFALRDFTFSLDPGTGPITIRGALETSTRLKTTLKTTTISGGTERERVFDLREPPVLNLNLSRRLVAMGLEEGKRIEVSVFDPATLTNGPAVLEVGAREVVRVVGRLVPAFKVKMTFSGIEAYSWITDVGDVVKEESPLGMIVLREERDRAMAIAMPSEVRSDMIAGAAIQPSSSRPIDDPSAILRLKLRFTGALPLSSPEELNGAGQTYKDFDFEIRDMTKAAAGPIEPGLDRYLQSEPLIESDAPEILAELGAALFPAGPNPTPRRKAEALVRYVNALLEKKPTMSLPSALEVLRTKVGDCNEHTALFVALARAAGIPARVAIGLTNLRGAFYYHAWAEVWIAEGRGGLWFPVDPTLNQFPADVTHIRLARGGFERQSAILPLLGAARIRVLEMEDDPTLAIGALVGSDRPVSATAPPVIDLPDPTTANSCWRRPRRN